MKIQDCLLVLTTLVGSVILTSCGTEPYAPPPTKATVTSVEVDVRNFGGRPDVYAIVEGTLSTTKAQLVDAKQHRKGYRLYLDIMEQTPRNSVGAMSNKPFRQRIPIEILGLTPGVYILNVNGIEKRLEIPGAGGGSRNEGRGEIL